MWSLWMCRGKVSTATCCVYAKGAGKCRGLTCGVSCSTLQNWWTMPVWPTGQLWVYEPYVPVCMRAAMVACKMCLKPHFSSAFLSPLLPSGSTNSMGDQCSGPEAGECVCGQCRCRQDVNPEVSLSPHHISLPSTSQSLVGQYTYICT